MKNIIQICSLLLAVVLLISVSATCVFAETDDGLYHGKMNTVTVWDNSSGVVKAEGEKQAYLKHRIP